MLKETNYKLRRSLLKDNICRSIYNSKFDLILRGSWKNDDFHLEIDENLTYSDVDLIAKFRSISEKEEIIESLKKEISKIINIKISIHPEDHLSKISLHDSKIKNVLEYLINYKMSDFNSRNYWKAKIMLLLMKNSERDQRYKEILNDFPSSAMRNLYRIKLGTEKFLDLNEIEKLVILHGDEIAKDFFERCLKGNPNDVYINYISDQFLSSVSISDWLKSYIIGKM